MSFKDLSGLYEAYMNVYDESEDVEEIDEANSGKSKIPNRTKPTIMPKSRERYIGTQKTDWDDPHPDTLNWGQTPPKRISQAEAAKKRLQNVIGTQRRQDREIKLREDSWDIYDLVLEYLLDEGLCESQENAEAMMAHMSEEWINSILDEAKIDNGLSDTEKERKRKERGNGGPTSHSLRRGHKTRGNMSHKYDSGRCED